MGDYHLSTRWVVRAPIEQVWEAIVDTQAWPDWWKGVVSAEVLDPGAADGIGRRVRYAFRSALPYTLSFDIVLREVRRPRLLLGDASGDLEGTGRWDLIEDGGVTTLACTWHVRTTGAAMSALTPLLRPAFVWNHHLVMRWGAEGLARRLDAPLLAVSSTPNTRITDVAPLAGLLTVLALAAHRWRGRCLW